MVTLWCHLKRETSGLAFGLSYNITVCIYSSRKVEYKEWNKIQITDGCKNTNWKKIQLYQWTLDFEDDLLTEKRKELYRVKMERITFLLWLNSEIPPPPELTPMWAFERYIHLLYSKFSITWSLPIVVSSDPNQTIFSIIGLEAGP